jgi:hypothetical protein
MGPVNRKAICVGKSLLPSDSIATLIEHRVSEVITGGGF